MRTVISLLSLTMIATGSVWSQATPPDVMNYQGVLRDASGAPLSGDFDMVFRLYDSDGGAPPCPAGGGTLLLTDSHLGAGAVTVAGGLFNVELGGGSVSPGAADTLSDVFRDYPTVYVEVEVESEALCPRVRVVSAGYALNAGNLDGRAASEFLDTSATAQNKVGDLALLGSVGIGTVTPANSLHLFYGSGIVMQGDSPGNLTLRFRDEDTANIYDIVGDPGTEGLSFRMNGTTTVYMGATGKVGIGTSVPSGTLEVAGDVVVSGIVDSSAGFRFPDGSVQASAATVRSLVTTLSAQGTVGVTNSIAIGTDGNPVIAYHDSTNGDLKVARCGDPSCRGATINTVDSAGNQGFYPSIAIGSDGNPVISYAGSGAGLKMARCGDPACGSATFNVIELAEVQATSIAIGIDGNPVIAYSDGAPVYDLKVAHCGDPGCGGFTINTVDSGGDVGRDCSIAVGTDGNPVISYADWTNRDLKVAHCNDAACNGATLNSVDSTNDVGLYTSIAIGADGNPVISYRDSTNLDLKAARCTDPSCNAAVLNTVDSSLTIGLGSYTSITIAPDGNPVISYYDLTNGDLKVAHCTDPDCGDASVRALDSAGNVGLSTSIAIGIDGLAVISYYDNTNQDLKVVTQVAGPVGQQGGALARDIGGHEGVQGDDLRAAPFPDSRSGAATYVATAGGSGPGATRGTSCNRGLVTDAEGNVYARSFRPSAADLASVFEVNEPAERGDVLVIDPERTGRLSLARRTADSAVFGVVSGEPGVLLGARARNKHHGEGTESEAHDAVSEPGADTAAAPARAPVAVSGIVLCKVDAAYGPIRPGDLLTTSPTAGHAMLAYDPRPGTILGKALEPLDSGTGLIKVLVMLR